MSLDMPILNWPQNKTIVLFHTGCTYMTVVHWDYHLRRMTLTIMFDFAWLMLDTWARRGGGGNSFNGLYGEAPGGVLPYVGYIGMCRCEGYGFQAVYSRIGYTPPERATFFRPQVYIWKGRDFTS